MVVKQLQNLVCAEKVTESGLVWIVVTLIIQFLLYHKRPQKHSGRNCDDEATGKKTTEGQGSKFEARQPNTKQ